jgi:hypothetical protein
VLLFSSHVLTQGAWKVCAHSNARDVCVVSMPSKQIEHVWAFCSVELEAAGVEVIILTGCTGFDIGVI